MKSINIKGKEYITVSERVREFNIQFPLGSITTELVTPVDSKLIIIKATITVPSLAKLITDNSVQLQQTRTFTGYSQAVVGDGMVNKTSALENAETSAVGRALGFMGIGIVDSIASADEMAKAGVVKKVSNQDEAPF